MPFAVRKRGNKWVVISKSSGRVLGTHKTKKKAIKQLRAVYANYNRKK